MKAAQLFCGMMLGILMVFAQPKASLTFEQDTMVVGKPITLVLRIQHSAQTAVFFPDSSTTFGEFEWIATEAIPTKTRDNTSIDAARYTLRSFQMQPKQGLKLSYRYLQNGDTLSKSIRSDSIRLIERINPKQNQLSFRADNQLIPLEAPPNYFLFTLVGILGLAVLILMIALLRPLVLKWMQKRTIRKEWREIRRQLKKTAAQNDLAQQLEALNRIWKDYLDQEWGSSLRSHSTSELIPIIQQRTQLNQGQKQQLIQTSKLADKVLYAGETVDAQEVKSLIQAVEPILQASYERRKKQQT